MLNNEIQRAVRLFVFPSVDIYSVLFSPRANSSRFDVSIRRRAVANIFNR